MIRAALALLLLAGCDAASVGGRSEAQAAYERESAAALVDLEAAIGLARGETGAACRVLALGENRCGGPTYYRPYSATDGDQAEIARLAERIAEIDRRAILTGVLRTPCIASVPPAPDLRDGRCSFVPRTAVN